MNPENLTAVALPAPGTHISQTIVLIHTRSRTPEKEAARDQRE